MQCLAVLLLLFVSPAGAALQFRDTRTFSFHIGDDHMTVLQSQLKVNDYTDLEALYKIHSTPETGHNAPHPQHQIRVYCHSPGRTVHLDTVVDPRVMVHEGLGVDGKMTGFQTKKPGATLTFKLPTDVTHVTVERGDRPKKPHVLSVPHRHFLHREFQVQEAALAAGADGDPVRLYDVEQLVGHPDYHKNIVFLAGGYTKEEKTKFKAAVYAAALSFMSGDLAFATGSAGLMPTPWDRYMPLINIFVVWQASKESGASIPLKADGSAHQGYTKVDKANSMNCVYGTEQIRYLNCDIDLMKKLAFDNTPANPKNTVVQTLVNDNIYGGTGGSRFCTVYAGEWTKCETPTDCVEVCDEDVRGCPNGKKTAWKANADNKYMQVLIHEFGHADSALSDEYDYNVKMTSTSKLPTTANCYQTNTGVPWKHWIGHPLGVMEPTTLGGSCSYTGFYKPTADLCLMNTARGEMCAACAEATILSVYRDTRALVSPRCPQQDELMVVVNTADWFRLEMSPKFVSASASQRDEGLQVPGAGAGTGLYARSHSGTLTPSYKKCTNSAANARLTRKASDKGIPADEIICVDTYDKIPLRQDLGDIRHTWYWPTTAAKDPTATSAPDGKIGALYAQPWRKVNGRWQMVGHVNWITDNVTGIKGALAQLWFQGDALGEGLHAFDLEVVDMTDFVIKAAFPDDPRVGNMTFRTTFRVDVKAPSDTKWAHCSASFSSTKKNETDTTSNECTAGKNKFTYCAVCDEGKICNNSFPYVPFEAQLDVGALLDTFEGQLFGLGGGIVGGGFVAILVFWFVLGKCLGNNISEIIEVKKPLKVARWLMLGFMAIVMLGAIGACATGIYFYKEMSLIGKLVTVVGIAVCAVLFLIAFIGFIAAFFRSKLQLMINGILLLILFVASVAIGWGIWKTGQMIDAGDDDLTTFLTTQWEDLVSGSNAAAMCTFQDTFQCSGLTIPCHNTFHSQCPDNCDVTNMKYPNPCWSVFQEQFKKYYFPGGGAVLGLCVVLFMQLIINWVLCCCIRRRGKSIQSRLGAVPQGAGTAHNDLLTVRCLRNLTATEMEKLGKQWSKFDKNKDGQMCPKEMKVFFYGTLRIKLSDTDVAMTLQRFDTNKNGSLCFPEFLEMCKTANSTAWG